MEPMPDIVCQIARGELDADIVWETPDVIAFLDRSPVFKGHTLVCPRRHATTLLDLPGQDMQPLWSSAQVIAAAMTPAFDAEGTFVAMNNTVSQSVPHLHIHVIPRSFGDGLKGFFWPRLRYAAGERAEYASRLAEAINRSTSTSTQAG